MKRNLHKNSFLTYNVVFHFSKSSGFYPGLELLNSLTLCRQTTFYYFRRCGRVGSLYTFLKATSPLFVTTNKEGGSFVQKNPLLTPMLLTIQKGQLSKEVQTLQTINSLPLLVLTVSFGTFLKKVVELYKIITQLYSYTLFHK
jgi:hypothetical protein